jgi:hypothetical protein
MPASCYGLKSKREAQTVRDQSPEETDRGWKGLLLIGGVAALVAAILFRRWLGSEYILLAKMGLFGSSPNSPPGDVSGWFALLQTKRLIGFTLLNGFDLVNYALVGLMFLGLYAALTGYDKSKTTLFLALAFLGIAIYFASNQALPLLALSDQYASATAIAQKSAILATGEVLLAMNNHAVFGSGVFWGFVLVTLAGLIVSVVMLQSGLFGKWASATGILANVLGLGYFFTLAIAPPLTFVPLSASAPFLLVWYILIGLKLLALFRAETPRT